MTQESTILILSAVSIGFFHTLFGPDHYLPFVVIARARKWSLAKTIFVSFLCGIGHIAGSILLGIVGIALVISVAKLEGIEAFRGDIASWLLIAFGLVYFVWGIRKVLKDRPHTHNHTHEDGKTHLHEHTHTKNHVHIHEKDTSNITPWILFTIFVFGPCEPLIPLLMYPAAKESFFTVLGVVIAFGAVTIATMCSIVVVLYLGVKILPLKRIERYTHLLAGATICICGLAIQFLGL